MYRFHKNELQRRKNPKITYTARLNRRLYEPEFLLKKEWAIANIEFKLKMIDLKLSREYGRKVMQKVEHRIKKADSIARKLMKKGCKIKFENALNRLNDIIGIRVVCLYSDDVYQIAELLKREKDLSLIKEKDYIKNPEKDQGKSMENTNTPRSLPHNTDFPLLQLPPAHW